MSLKTLLLHDKQQIESFLRKNIYLHLYSIGDLDDFFWNYTTWYGCVDEHTIRAIALLYMGGDLPCLLALSEEKCTFMPQLLSSIVHRLPIEFYCHLTPELKSHFLEKYQFDSYGLHYKMALIDRSRCFEIDTSAVFRLSTADLPDLQELYTQSYPGNWFDSRMLNTHQYFGVWVRNKLISVAGIHVYSPQYGVAALGNITTHPDFRGQGWGTKVTAKLCQSLLESVNEIGLNVKADNVNAIHCYETLGFDVVAAYEEAMVQHYPLNSRSG